jgi:hypothetical protein
VDWLVDWLLERPTNLCYKHLAVGTCRGCTAESGNVDRPGSFYRWRYYGRVR